MKKIHFEWDESKAEINQKKHQVFFEEVMTVFSDVLEEDVISYFKKMAEGVGIPYQSLINLYLKDCVSSHRELKIQWE